MLLLITILDQENQEHHCLINTNHIILISEPADGYWRKFAIDSPDYPKPAIPTDAKSFIEIIGEHGYFVAESLADIATYMIERRKFENAYVHGVLND